MFENQSPRITSSENTITGDLLITSPNCRADSLASAVAAHLSQVSRFLFRSELGGPIGQAPHFVVKKIVLDPVNPFKELALMDAITFKTEGDRIRVSSMGIGCDPETKALLGLYFQGLTRGD